MTCLTLRVLPRQVKDEAKWQEYMNRMKPLRLRSLKEDSRSFVSKYEDEAKEPESFWMGRLKDRKAWHVVTLSSPEELAEGEDAMLRADVTWVAFCVMVDPDVKDEIVPDNGDPQLSKEHSEWFMAAVWVAPELRGKGAGKKLVQCGIDTARKADAERGINGRTCNTMVVRGNEGALDLYKKIGFEVADLEASIEKDGVRHYGYELKIAL